MKHPSLYINVSQTIFAVLAAGLVGSFIFNKDFRKDVVDIFNSVSGGSYVKR